MIITLIGANFANSNIGTLSTWRISTILGAGATYSGPESLDRESNTGLSATVTIAEGYEIGAAGVSVTVSGQAVTSGVTVSGNTVTINITTKIEGNVVIKVPTKNTSTGEEDNGSGGGTTDPTPDVPPTTYYFKDQTNVGYLRGGQYIESAKSATTDYIDISSKPKIGYYGRMGFVSGDTFHALEFYDSNKNYLADLSVLGTGSPMYQNIDLSDSKYANAKYVRASVSQSSYTQEQFESWYFVVGSFIEEAPTVETLKAMFPEDGYLGTDGALVAGTSSGNAYTTDYVSLSGKTNIAYKGRMGTIGLNMAFYDSSKNLISGLETVGNGNFITLDIDLSDSNYSNAAYVRASISRGALDETTWLSSSFKIS